MRGKFKERSRIFISGSNDWTLAITAGAAATLQSRFARQLPLHKGAFVFIRLRPVFYLPTLSNKGWRPRQPVCRSKKHAVILNELRAVVKQARKRHMRQGVSERTQKPPVILSVSEGSRILWLRCPVHGILHRFAVQNDSGFAISIPRCRAVSRA